MRQICEPLPGLMGDPSFLSSDDANRLILSRVVEHHLAQEYFEVGKAAGPLRANENDKWLERNGETRRTALRAELDTPDRQAFRREMVSKRFRMATIAAYEINAFRS